LLSRLCKLSGGTADCFFQRLGEKRPFTVRQPHHDRTSPDSRVISRKRSDREILDSSPPLRSGSESHCSLC
jgi:hypothetical protein